MIQSSGAPSCSASRARHLLSLWEKEEEEEDDEEEEDIFKPVSILAVVTFQVDCNI